MQERYPYDTAAKILKVMAHPVRISIVALLESKRMNGKEIQKAIKAKQSITSQNLTSLADKGILGRDRHGNEVFYFIKNKNVLKLLSCIKGCCK